MTYAWIISSLIRSFIRPVFVGLALFKTLKSLAEVAKVVSVRIFTLLVCAGRFFHRLIDGAYTRPYTSCQMPLNRHDTDDSSSDFDPSLEPPDEEKVIKKPVCSARSEPR